MVSNKSITGNYGIDNLSGNANSTNVTMRAVSTEVTLSSGNDNIMHPSRSPPPEQL
ncbi:hypothetical protein [Candidatus Ichthyocystis hellenicum]|uniref:hypothetical protein n=1 Tax=Candidatus Ichthyocystis hellenicum TaxID=1561003 RepID=UPI001584F646|nr:hypothetical protein [Candidatus Ichthyocystis hellenicum]